MATTAAGLATLGTLPDEAHASRLLLLLEVLELDHKPS
jgi:hypothetical protein